MRQPGQTGLIQFSLLEDHRSIKMPHLVFLVHCHHPSNQKIGRQLGENFLNKKVKSDSVFRTENQVLNEMSHSFVAWHFMSMDL